MCNILCVTSRRLVQGDFLTQVERVAAAKVQGIILREKDLPEEEYAHLAGQVQKICGKYNVPLMVHTFHTVADRLGIRRLHLPLRACLELEAEKRKSYEVLGVSVHSVEEALEAQRAGADYVTAGHIFATDCKAGLAPRGTDFLKAVCESVSIPVYAIGGIGPAHAATCIRAGAKGVCLMSSLMKTENAEAYIEKFRSATGS